MDKATSIEAFELDCRVLPRLTPRSHFALRSLGLSPRELQYRPIEEYLVPEVPHQIGLLRYNHCEEKRKEKIQLVLAQKQANQEQHASMSLSKSYVLEKARMDSSKFERKRNQELYTLLNSQLRLHELISKKQEMNAKEQAIYEARLAEQERLNKEKAMRKYELEMQKLAEKHKESQLHKKHLNRLYELESQKLIEKTEKESKILEARRHKSAGKPQARQLSQQKLELDKALAFQKREEEHKKLVQELQKHRSQAASLAWQEKLNKINLAKEKLEEMTSQRSQVLLDKQKAYNEKTKKFELLKEEIRRQIAKKAEEKDMNIKKRQLAKSQEMKKRRKKWLENYESIDKKYKDFHEQKHNDALRRKKVEEEHIAKQKIVTEKLKQIENEKINRYLSKIEEKNAKQEETIRRNELKKMIKEEVENLKKQDRRELVERKRKRSLFRKEYLLSKLREEEERISHLQKLHGKIIHERSYSREKHFFEKSKLLGMLDDAKKEPDLNKQSDLMLKALSKTGSFFIDRDKEIKNVKERNKSRLDEVIEQEEKAEEERKLLLNKATHSQRKLLKKHLEGARELSRKKIRAVSKKNEKDLARLCNSLILN